MGRQPKAWTGDVGGGLWIMSSHAPTHRPSRGAHLAGHFDSGPGPLGGLPGVRAGGKSWIAAEDSSGFCATPLAPAFATAAAEVWPGWSETPWDVYGIWASTVLPNLTAGQSFSSQLPGFAAQISNYAQSDGFQVVSKP